MDNHFTHITLEVINTALENSYLILTMPPHFTHKLQSLDVGVIGSFKRFYSRSCSNRDSSDPRHSLSIYFVAELTAKALYKASSFRCTGIFPFNKDIFTEDQYLLSTISDQLVPVDILLSCRTNLLQKKNALGSSLFDVTPCSSVVNEQIQSSKDVSLVSFWPFFNGNERPRSLRKKSSHRY